MEALARRTDISDAERKAEQDRLEVVSRGAQQEIMAVYRDVRTASPAYQLMVGRDFKPFALADVQKWLAERQAVILEYFSGADGTYVLVISAGRRSSQPRFDDFRRAVAGS